jgi:hypothetical protein
MPASAAGSFQTDYGTPSAVPASSVLQAQDANSSAYASAYANYGVLKAFVAGYGTAYSTSTAAAGASFSDFVTISNPELDGKVGYYGNSYHSEINASVSNNGDQSFYNDGVTTTDLYGLRYDPVGHYLNFTDQFVYGSAFMIYMNMGVDGSTGSNQNGGTSRYLADAAHSGYWNGIVATSFDGKAVTDYTLSSQSGTDYSHSFAPAADVPEPGALSLVAAGLAGLVRARRKKAA